MIATLRVFLILVFAVSAAACGYAQPPPVPASVPVGVQASAQERARSFEQSLELRYKAENDRVCRRILGLSCNATPHLMGPVDATYGHERLACVHGTIAVFVSGQWTPDLKYQDPKSGARYGDGCLAISM